MHVECLWLPMETCHNTHQSWKHHQFWKQNAQLDGTPLIFFLPVTPSTPAHLQPPAALLLHPENWALRAASPLSHATAAQGAQQRPTLCRTCCFPSSAQPHLCKTSQVTVVCFCHCVVNLISSRKQEIKTVFGMLNFQNDLLQLLSVHNKRMSKEEKSWKFI